jgi:hypothetical protein
MVVNATFNNISTISWQSVLLVEETFSTTIQCRFIIHFVLDPHIYHGVYMSGRHMSSVTF